MFKSGSPAISNPSALKEECFAARWLKALMIVSVSDIVLRGVSSYSALNSQSLLQADQSIRLVYIFSLMILYNSHRFLTPVLPLARIMPLLDFTF